jgi:PAS domain S-box-containing protein
MEPLAYVAISVGISISAIIVAIRLAWLHPVPVVKAGALDVTAAAFWLLASGLVLTSSSLSVKFLIYQIGFFGIVLVEPCWLTLSMIISGYERFVNRRNILALSVMPIITLALVFTNGYHGLIFSKVELNPADPMLPLSLTPGLAFGLIVLAYSYALDGAGIVFLVKRLLVSRQSFRPQIYLLLAASLIPWLTNVLYLSNQNSFGYIEPTSLTLTVAGAIVIWRTAHWSGSYIAPIAHEVMIDNMNDAVIVLDYERRVVDINPIAEILFGRSHSDVVGQPVESAWPEWPRISKVLDDKTPGTKEVSFDSDDMKRYYELESTRLPGFTTDEVNILITLRDVTDSKIMEEKLRQYSEHLEELVGDRTRRLSESEARFRELANLLPQIVFEINQRGNYTFVNRSGIASAGYTEEEVLSGLNALQTFVEQDRGRIKENIGKILTGEDLGASEYTALRKDGTTFPVMIHSRAIIHEGKPVGVRGIAIDVTERKRIENALRESERRFRELADLLPQIVFETDERGILTFFNRVGLSSTGYTEEELRSGFDPSKAFPPADAKRAMDAMRKVLRGEPGSPEEYALLRKDGTSFPIMIYSSAIIREGKPVGLRGIMVDMTERKKLESQLIESHRLAAIGQTTTMVGHDLRNPLQAMTSAVYLVKKLVASEKTEDKKEAVGLLSTLDDMIRYMDKIVSDLQDYARPVGADLVETSLPDLVRAIVSSVRIPGNVQVTLDIHDGSSNLKLDATLFTRVLTNLILNAVQAMPNGGKMIIAGSSGDGSITVAVQDTGVGIAPENLEKIFDPFFTTKAQGQGLGLPVCKRLIEGQGGTIAVTSHVGKGSAFTFKVPTNRGPVT